MVVSEARCALPGAQLLIIVILFALCGVLRAAEGIRTLPDSAAAMGMAGGRLANLGDSSVTRSNPANLTVLDGPQLMVTLQPWYGDTDFTGVGGEESSMTDPWKPLGSFYAAMPVSEDVTLGLGLAAPFGVGITWPRDSPFRYLAPYDASVQTAALNPAIGIRVNDRLSLGFGLDIIYSKMELKQDYPWFLAFPGAVDGRMNFEGSGWGIGAYVGMTFKITDNQRLAITGRLPVDVDYSGDFDISNVPDAAAGVFTSSSSFQSEIEHPGSIGIGYGIDVNERLTLGADFEWIGNSSHDDLPLYIGSNQGLLPADRVLLDWKDSWTAGFGLRYEINEQFTVRTGYMFSKSAFRDRTYTPVIPTNDRHIFSAGLGYRCGNNQLDFAYSLVPMETRKVRGNQQPAFDGDYDILWSVFTLSYTRMF